MAIFSDVIIDSVKKKMQRDGYEALTPNELLIVVSAHFNDEVTSLKKAVWSSVYGLWIGLWAVAASIVANIVFK